MLNITFKGDAIMKSRFFNISTLKIIGVLIIFLSAIALLWHGNANSNQATMPLTAKVYFDGEYRIANGKWQKIEKGKHISSTKGDVTLRGNFHTLTPDGEYVGLYDGEMPIAFYTNHISLTFYDGENEPQINDTENPLFGNSFCGVNWSAYTFTSKNDKPIEILIHNPHKFGNENAIDELLSNTAFWTGIEFEKNVLARGEPQRDVGLLFVIISLMFLGCALFSTLIHIKNNKIIWILGIVILSAGSYLTYSSNSISFWSESVVFNTTMLGCSIIFYMFFLSLALVHFLKATKSISTITVIILGVFNIIFLILPILTEILFYNLLLYWVILQMLSNTILMYCLIKEFLITKDKTRWFYISSVLPLIAFAFDIIFIKFGFYQQGLACELIFIVFFIAAIVAVLKIIPSSINAIAKTKKLETEKISLNAKLTESRVSTMISQIRPHFIYNTLGSIEQLCIIDPSKAGELVHNFAKYLRGNFRELDNPKPILMSQEMEHAHHYVSIEKVRFPDMTFTFDMNSNDFYIPALTIQPIVENAIKHGLMKLSKGGTIRVVSYETDLHYCVLVEDDGVGFDTNLLLDEKSHVGIRNIRSRLEAMVNGELEIESAIEKGTKVLIKIPKGVSK